MPLRDHFRSPLDDITSWEGFHGGWPMVIVQKLRSKLPRRFVAAPRLHSGSLIEVDVATFEKDEPGPYVDVANGNTGVTTAFWAAARPTFTVTTDLLVLDEFEVRVYDSRRARRLSLPSR